MAKVGRMGDGEGGDTAKAMVGEGGGAHLMRGRSLGTIETLASLQCREGSRRGFTGQVVVIAASGSKRKAKRREVSD